MTHYEREKLPLLAEDIKDVPAQIPDDELTKWKETFQELGLSEKEIRRRLSLMNQNFAAAEFGVSTDALKKRKERHDQYRDRQDHLNQRIKDKGENN